jgi:hypothetical protein
MSYVGILGTRSKRFLPVFLLFLLLPSLPVGLQPVLSLIYHHDSSHVLEKHRLIIPGTTMAHSMLLSASNAFFPYE